jgi:hypothetical protein
MDLQRSVKMSDEYQKFIDDIVIKVDDFIFSNPNFKKYVKK